MSLKNICANFFKLDRLTFDEQGDRNTGFSLVVLGLDLECPSILGLDAVQGQRCVVDVAFLVCGDCHSI